MRWAVVFVAIRRSCVKQEPVVVVVRKTGTCGAACCGGRGYGPFERLKRENPLTRRLEQVWPPPTFLFYARTITTEDMLAVPRLAG